jgi:ferritin-like metal-binding protein YciE
MSRELDREQAPKETPMSDLTTRDAKVIQYLTEAYGKEKQLETALEAHIALATRVAYRRRLQTHLTETRRHARELKRRIKALGGVVNGMAIPVPESVSDRMSEVALRLLSGTQKAAALAQGPFHALRGASDAERQLKNAKDEYSEEAQEIATYTAIESLAQLVGDRETARLARSIRRDEERMASFLEREIPRLTRAVAQAEIPPAERRTPRRRRTGTRRTSRTRRTTATRRTSATRRRPSGTRSAGGTRASTARRSTSARTSRRRAS